MKRFNTFEGVFTPSILSILGAIMYLRLGWVVGQVGLAQALVIIVIANSISILTALSMSSIVTNIRIGTGGAYSIITKSLGVEVGGSIGIPLYLSQAISVAFYIVGFSECWGMLFPGHPALLVSLTTWLMLLIVSYVSARLAFRLQFGVMALIAISFFSIFLSQRPAVETPDLWRHFEAGNFWVVFAVFFPAVTGLLAGATMSGELRDPKKSIPLGTMAAILLGFTIYLGLAVWLGFHGTSSELTSRSSFLIDVSRWRWMVVAGLMGATLSSALSMFVASPRTLLALSKNQSIPLFGQFSRINKKGEPTTAILFTALLALVTLMFGSLNQVAGLLTMFFLITYAMINCSVFIEQSIGLASFRPSFRIPTVISLLGSLACIILMIVINPVFSFIAIISIYFIYWMLLKREIRIYSPDVRSGLLVFMAEHLAKTAAKLPYHPKIWKPNMLVSVASPEELQKISELLRVSTLPNGRITVFHVIEKGILERFVHQKEQKRKDDKRLSYKDEVRVKFDDVVKPLREEGIYVAQSITESPEYFNAASIVIQTLKGTFFPPNIFFFTISDDPNKDKMVEAIIAKAEEENLGVIVFLSDSKKECGRASDANLWIRQKSPNLDLSILMALQIARNWETRIRIIQVVEDVAVQDEARHYLLKLKGLMRMPLETEIHIMTGIFKEVVKEAPPAGINIFGMPQEPDLSSMREINGLIESPVLFLRDSQQEKATA